jgi:hypothetical protein
MTRYPFGLHGYHRPSGRTGKVEWADPLNVMSSDPNPAGVAAQQAQEEEARKQTVRDRINKMYGVGDDPEAQAAKTQLATEGKNVGDATSSYYTDQLGRGYTAAERNARFNLARQGLLGGSADSDQQGQLKSDRDLGATRIGEASRSAVTALQAQREQERLNATGLVNAGTGSEAVRAASTGLQSSLNNASSANKANIFGDLFAGTADNAAAQNYNDANAAMAARFQNKLGAFFPNRSASAGRVTPSV